MDASLIQFLTFVAYGGGAVVVVSFLAERSAKFQNLASNVKQNLAFGVSAVLALGAWALVTYVPSTVLAFLNTPFTIVAGVFASYYLGQAFHFFDKLPNKS